jgi:hypothetical protein
MEQTPNNQDPVQTPQGEQLNMPTVQELGQMMQFITNTMQQMQQWQQNMPTQLPTRQRETWCPDDMFMDRVRSWTTKIDDFSLPEKDRKEIIDKYAPIDGLDYNPASSYEFNGVKLNKTQKIYDNQFKHVMYLLTGVLRPIDVTPQQVINNQDTEVIQYAIALDDIRSLVANAIHTLKQYRMESVLKSIDSSFSLILKDEHHKKM